MQRNTFETIEKIHTGTHFFQADCFLVRMADGRLAVWKDYARSKGSFGRFMARVFAAREARAYRRLDTLAGIPELYGSPTDWSLLIEHISGLNLAHVDYPLEEAFFDKLDRILECMHNLGVTHGEVRPVNVLATPDGTPYVIDLTTASTVDPAHPGLIFRIQRAMDRCGVLMMKKHFLGTLSPADAREARRLRFLALIFRRRVA